MILQALTKHYETLSKKDGTFPTRGWSIERVSFGLNIGQNGELISVLYLKTEQARGKKLVFLPRSMKVPLHSVRSGKGPPSYFLCDSARYFLGLNASDSGQVCIDKDYFAKAQSLHKEVLADANSTAAKAVTAFFDTWNPEETLTHPFLQEKWDEIVGNGNFLFYVEGECTLNDVEICAAWERYSQSEAQDEAEMQCLVTGEMASIPKTHSKIKGIAGGLSMGGTLVGFNAPAFESFSREQNLNSPVGAHAAFAYTTALNHLLAQRENVHTLGDTTLVCWAENGENAYQEVGMMCMLGNASQDIEPVLQGAVSLLCCGRAAQWENITLQPDTEFYILGLSPNAARISVRFFLHNQFGAFLSNITAHKERLEIVRPSFEKYTSLPLWHLLQETVNQNAKDKSPQPQLAGSLLRSILEGYRYPATLLSGLTLRIRAEKTINWKRAAILKAYYLQNPHPLFPKEELTVSLNENSTNIPYTLGRIFSVLEAIQKDASGDINTTIKDKYFNSASATPAVIFPVLINLSQKHLRKLDDGKKIHWDKQLQSLLSVLCESYPQRLALPEQGAFQLGYYHQTQHRYTKKEEK